MRRVLPFLVLCVGCSGPELPDPAYYSCDVDALGATPDHPHAERYQRVVDQLLDLGLPSVSVAVSSPDGLWVGAGGMADIEQGVALEPCDRFFVGSSSKMIAASAIMRLVEQGRLDLDAPAKVYLPAEVVAHIDQADQVTIRQLLSHHTGIPDYVTPKYLMEGFNFSLEPWSASETLERYVYDQPALFAPDADWSYSNSNYLLLGLILEDITGLPAYDATRALVQDPLGMDGTAGGSEDPEALVRGYATLHGSWKMVDHTEATESVMGGPGKLDGGFVMPARDLAVLLDGLAHGGLLGADTLAEMTDFYEGGDPGAPLSVGYGLGLIALETDWGPAWGHYGGVWPYSSLAFYFPDQDTSVVVELNAQLPEEIEALYDDTIFGLAFQD